MSNRLKVESSINIYEIGSEDTKGLTLPQVVVRSHWNDGDRVVIVIGDEPAVTVVGSDLIAAIHNAQNAR